MRSWTIFGRRWTNSRSLPKSKPNYDNRQQHTIGYCRRPHTGRGSRLGIAQAAERLHRSRELTRPVFRRTFASKEFPP